MFEIVIKPVDALIEVEREDMRTIFNETFALEEPNGIEWSEAEWMLLGMVNGHAVSMVGVVPREVLVGETGVRLGGIGGVATRPAYQRRGYAGQLMEAAAGLMRDTLHLPFGLLVCAPERVPYYAKFGWQPMSAPLYMRQRGERVPFNAPTMTLAMAGEVWPDGIVDLQGNPW